MHLQQEHLLLSSAVVHGWAGLHDRLELGVHRILPARQVTASHVPSQMRRKNLFPQSVGLF